MSTVKAINLQHPSSANSNIVFDNSGNASVTGRVGIGNSSPQTSLHIGLDKGFSSNGSSRFTLTPSQKATMHITAGTNGSSASNTYQYGVTLQVPSWGTQAGMIIAENGSDGTAIGFYTSINYADPPKLGLSVDPGGRINTPLQPAFRVHNGSAGSGAIISFASADTAFNGRNSGWNGSNKYTAPVAGVYWFGFAALINGGNYGRILFQINGSAATSYGDTLIGTIGSYISVSNAQCFYLNAGDYIQLYNEQAALYSGNYSSFSGYLVG